MILAMAGGGAERQLAYLAPALAGRGHEVHLAYIYPGVHLDALRPSCELHRIRAWSKYDPLLPLRTLALVRRLRPDVVQTWLTHMDIVGGAAARLLRVPWVMTERSAALCYPPTALNFLRRTLGKHADLIAANSPGGADYWTSVGFDRARIEVIPNCLPAEMFAAAKPLDDARVADGDEVVLHAGRLAPEKNLPTVIEAMQAVVRARPRARLVLCGEGPLRDDLQRRAREAGLSDRVLFAGFVSNVASWMERASAVIAVSSYEGHPNAVLEAVAAGAPLVVSDIPGYRAVLPDDAALFVEVRNAASLAEGLLKTLDDRGAATQRAARARTAVEALSLDNVTSRYEAMYRRLLERAS